MANGSQRDNIFFRKRKRLNQCAKMQKNANKRQQTPTNTEIYMAQTQWRKKCRNRKNLFLENIDINRLSDGAIRQSCNLIRTIFHIFSSRLFTFEVLRYDRPSHSL